MDKLRRHLSFTQLRFHWRRLLTAPMKPWSSASVVRWVSTKIVWLAAFVRIENDNSVIARVCKRWGWENCFIEAGKWGGGHDEDRSCNHTVCVIHVDWKRREWDLDSWSVYQWFLETLYSFEFLSLMFARGTFLACVAGGFVGVCSGGPRMSCEKNGDEEGKLNIICQHQWVFWLPPLPTPFVYPMNPTNQRVVRNLKLVDFNAGFTPNWSKQIHTFWRRKHP